MRRGGEGEERAGLGSAPAETRQGLEGRGLEVYGARPAPPFSSHGPPASAHGRWRR